MKLNFLSSLLFQFSCHSFSFSLSLSKHNSLSFSLIIHKCPRTHSWDQINIFDINQQAPRRWPSPLTPTKARSVWLVNTCVFLHWSKGHCWDNLPSPGQQGEVFASGLWGDGEPRSEPGQLWSVRWIFELTEAFVYSLCTFSSPNGFTSFGIYCSSACLVVLFFFLVLLRREMLVVGGERISEVLFLQVLKRAAHSTGRDFLKSISTSASVWLLLFQRYFLVCFSAEHISTQRKIEPCFCFVYSHSWILGYPEEPNIILCRGGGVGGVALQKNWCMWINAGSVSPK